LASLLIEDDWRLAIVENKQFGDVDFGVVGFDVEIIEIDGREGKMLESGFRGFE
jgi:hypothetical protein